MEQEQIKLSMAEDIAYQIGKIECEVNYLNMQRDSLLKRLKEMKEQEEAVKKKD